MNGPFPVKTREQIAAEYGITVPTLKRWLKKRNIALPRNELLYPSLQIEVYEALGYPAGVRRLSAKEERMEERKAAIWKGPDRCAGIILSEPDRHAGE